MRQGRYALVYVHGGHHLYGWDDSRVAPEVKKRISVRDYNLPSLYLNSLYTSIIDSPFTITETHRKPTVACSAHRTDLLRP